MLRTGVQAWKNECKLSVKGGAPGEIRRGVGFARALVSSNVELQFQVLLICLAASTGLRFGAVSRHKCTDGLLFSRVALHCDGRGHVRHASDMQRRHCSLGMCRRISDTDEPALGSGQAGNRTGAGYEGA